MRSFSVSERRILRLLIVIAILSRLALAFRPDWRVCSRPYNDDSFYLFSVSNHLAHGDGLTVDGIHPTNGIQPLITFLYTPFFLIAGDKMLSLHLSFIVIALCDALSVLFIAKLVKLLARRKNDKETIAWLRPPIIAAALWTFLYPILIHTGNGLETALYSTCIIASTYYYCLLRQRPYPKVIQWVGFGVLLGLTVLSRIDAAIFVAAIAIVEVIRFKREGIKTAFIFGTTAILVSSPWWIFNYQTFGSIMPQSGQSEALIDMTAENIRRGAIVIGDIFTVFFFLPNYELPAWFHYFWLLVTGGMVLWLMKRFKIRSYLNERYDLGGLLPLTIASIAFIVYYVFFFGAPHFLPRYFHPLRILWVVLFSCSIGVFINRYRTWLRSNRMLARTMLAAVVLGVVGFNVSRYVYYFTVSSPTDLFQTAEWAQKRPGKLIGMEQTGITGFFSPNVVNLDGKVNIEALEARRRGDIGAYIAQRNFDYIADWEHFSVPMVESAERHGAHFKRVDSIGNVIIFERIR